MKPDPVKNPSSLAIIPAVDVKDGRCVRLIQGDSDRKTVYYDHPAEAVRRWVGEGAARLHWVDLDGAFSGKPVNADVLRRVKEEFDIEIEVGGGIRRIEDIDLYMQMGVAHVILGTSACMQPDLVKAALDRYGPQAIYVGADCRQGMVSVRGWTQDTGLEIREFIGSMIQAGVQTMIVTDIAVDGMLTGPNIGLYRRLLKSNPFRLIASGGISSVDDIVRLKELVPLGLEGCIVGKALYDGKIDLHTALASL